MLDDDDDDDDDRKGLGDSADSGGDSVVSEIKYMLISREHRLQRVKI